MRRRWLALLLCLLVCLACAVRFVAAGGNTLSVNETATQILFADAQTRILLAVENNSGQTINARLRLELIAPDDRVRAMAMRAEQIKPGASALTVPLAPALLNTLTEDERKLLMWYRLRYQITEATNRADAPVLTEGIVSVSRLRAPDIFELHVAAPRNAREGQPLRARVRALHPLTAQPATGVRVAGAFTFDGADGDDVVLKAAGLTDADGYALLDFSVPRAVDDDEGELKITARRGDFAQAAESDIEFAHRAQILITTDKPLYQPGQTLHVRALVFDPAQHALADTEALLTVSDPVGTDVFRAPLKTSRFGVASVDWPLPDDTRLGDYQLKVEIEDGGYEDSDASASVRISRYELPNFVVNVKPDRAYYLPTQDADVEVRADYLFGEPVKRGHVRVVRETERTWNYREQKWDVDEGDKYEGDTDDAGRFVAHVKLADDHKDFADESYNRFRDLTYAAYYTDPTTNRTEQRRFDLRLTREPIHIYVIEGQERPANNLPFEFYVSTSYADGTPATCTVAVSKPATDEAQTTQGTTRAQATLRTVQTNQYGVAKVTGLMLPPRREQDNNRVELQFAARDEKGSTGRHTEEFYPTDETVVRVNTDKALYRPGEPVKVVITANVPELKVVVDVARDYVVLRSELIELHDGRATVMLPYTPDMRDEITIAAFSFAHRDETDDDYAAGWRTVLFPRNRDLQLDVQMNKEKYRPGEDAHASVHVRGADGRAAASALGIVIYDRAVEERARTDGEFGANSYYNLYRYWHGTDSVAGIARGDLNHIDLTKPLPAGLDLVAEMLLRADSIDAKLFSGFALVKDEQAVFDKLVTAQLAALSQTLEGQYKAQAVYPANEQGLRRLLFAGGVEFDALRDPWGTPFRARFSVERETDVLDILSAGADKRFDTTDDFTALRLTRPYFRFTGEAINRAVARYHTRTGSYIRDAVTLKNELTREGLDFDALRDPWGQPYRLRFDAANTKFLVNVESSGPDQKLNADNDPKSDDFRLWSAQIDYSTDLRAQLDAALARYYAATARFPQDRTEFDAALARAGESVNILADPWGHPFYVTFRQDARYADRVSVQTYAQYGEQLKDKTEITPVTQSVKHIDLRSAGPDGQEGTWDDFDVATFWRIITEQAAQDKTPRLVTTPVQFRGASGALTGTVTDPNGAVVPGATIEATHKLTATVFRATSDDDGKFLLRNLPAGFYDVRFSSSGFKDAVIVNVPVRSSSLTQINAMLEVGNIAETVEVTAGNAGLLNTSTASVGAIVSRQVIDLPLAERNARKLLLLRPGATSSDSEQTATPRLREYFPETLLWQPSLETDRTGRAQVDFKLADNITTWKLSVFGSTETGEVGATEREIRAFQPFFIEHDPPRVLTEGDEIMLPVVLRNYLAHAQQVSVRIKPADWFTLLTAPERRAEVPAGDAARELFGFRAISSVKDGKQRVTAIGADASDAIEKPVNVHPDGEEIAQSSMQLFDTAGLIETNVPANMIPRSARAELKVYPNLMTHVIESVEAIMTRPHGCAEQTISSTYPSLLVLRHYRRLHGDDAPLPPVGVKAKKYLRAGYERLLSYRAPGGGFSYWGRGEADLALTAYAMRFLEDAHELIEVDDDVLQAARTWLVGQQQRDGSWLAYEWDKQQPGRRTLLLTAYIARVLARHRDEAPQDSKAQAQQPTPTPAQTTSKDPARAPQPPALQRALDYLAPHVTEIDEPYFIAAYTLAAIDAGAPPANIAKATERLRALAKDEAGSAYWALETNTPFYGWGLAGRIETTALAVQALMQTNTDAQLTDRGLLFLLRNKDAQGVWLSTQATVNVLDALVALSPARDAEMKNTNVVSASRPATEPAEVFVNAQRAGTIELPTDERLDSPLTLDLTRFVAPGQNRVEIKRTHGTRKAFAQVVTTYYVPWSKPAGEATHHATPEAASALRLKVSFDKTSAGAGEEIACRVEAERIGFHGYGMILAEVGLPPGADVDRASLERALKESGWEFSSYDVLPDRLVAYLWPRAGGTRFTFTFRPRYGLKAETAPSLLYDYYNPEARAVLAPTRFNVIERARVEQAKQ
ncbi:MAG: MG2 domain-containing protein [Pyrinomonadaceae bacterium]